MLVGREKELHLLHDIQNDDSSHFVAVYYEGEWERPF